MKNHRAENTATRRMFRPSSVEAPNHSKLGWTNSWSTTSSATMPPRYPMPQPKPLTLPMFFGVEIWASMAL